MHARISAINIILGVNLYGDEGIISSTEAAILEVPAAVGMSPYLVHLNVPFMSHTIIEGTVCSMQQLLNELRYYF